jgi:hypothetical protein
MTSLDIMIAVAYVAAFLITNKKEYINCFFAMAFSSVFFLLVVDIFRAQNNGIECLYFLILSAIWLVCSTTIKCSKLKTAVMVMTTYELLCAIESLIWQFVQPVLTPAISNYIINVILIHIVILISINRWGVKIEEPMERVFSNGKHFVFSIFSIKSVARDNTEIKR